jgi:hypothetical protein
VHTSLMLSDRQIMDRDPTNDERIATDEITPP